MTRRWRIFRDVLIATAFVGAAVLSGYGLKHCDLPPEPREAMERSLGSGSVCGELVDDKATCIQGERRFLCVSHHDRIACQVQP